MTERIVAFPNFANAPKKLSLQLKHSRENFKMENFTEILLKSANHIQFLVKIGQIFDPLHNRTVHYINKRSLLFERQRKKAQPEGSKWPLTI